MDSPPPPVPAEALYGASTQRAVLNFPVSHQPVDPGIIHAYGLIKWAAAHVNGELGHVPVEKTALIQQAAQEVYEGNSMNSGSPKSNSPPLSTQRP